MDLPVTPGCRGRSDIHCERGPGCSRHCCSDPPPEPQSSLTSWSQPGKKESELSIIPFLCLSLIISSHLSYLEKNRKNKTPHHEIKENLRDPQTSQAKKKGTNISHWWTLLSVLVLFPLCSWLLFYQQKWGGRKETIGHDRSGREMLGRETRRGTRDHPPHSFWATDSRSYTLHKHEHAFTSPTSCELDTQTLTGHFLSKEPETSKDQVTCLEPIRIWEWAKQFLLVS